MPIVYDKTEGFYTKWVLLEFPYQFKTIDEIQSLPENERANKKVIDTEIIEKISTPEEMSGFLNEALDGLERLKKNHTFSNSVGSREIKEFWVRKSDSFYSFCMDLLQENQQSFIKKAELRRIYSKYCRKYVLRSASDKAIKHRLEEAFGVSEIKPSVDGVQEYCWGGIKFKDSIQHIQDILSNSNNSYNSLSTFSKIVDTLDRKKKSLFDYGKKSFVALSTVTFPAQFGETTEEIVLETGHLYSSVHLGDYSNEIIEILLSENKIQLVEGWSKDDNKLKGGNKNDKESNETS